MNLYEFEFKRTFHLEGCEKVGKYQIAAKNEQMAYFKLGQTYSDQRGEYDVEILSCTLVVKGHITTHEKQNADVG